jgi:hypothetical protein
MLIFQKEFLCWANEQVVAGADEIDEKKEVVSDEAVYSLIVGYGVPRPELNHYLF